MYGITANGPTAFRFVWQLGPALLMSAQISFISSVEMPHASTISLSVAVFRQFMHACMEPCSTSATASPRARLCPTCVAASALRSGGESLSSSAHMRSLAMSSAGCNETRLAFANSAKRCVSEV
eukprot:5816771-Prymnesium_polylepis.1